MALLKGPVVSSWLAAAKWMQTPVKEALPLPLFVMCDLEAALSSAPAEDQWLIGGFLLMVWCSLRFSDVQRLELSSVRIIDSTLRGWCSGLLSSEGGLRA